MLQSINDKLKGWITWTIIIAVSGVFVFTGISYFFVSGGVSPQAVAKVGAVQISQNTYQQMLAQNMQTQGGNSEEVQQRTLQQLVDQSLLQQDAQASNIVITQAAINSAIFSNPAFMDNGKYSATKFDEIAKYYGSPGAIKSLIASNLITSSIVNPIMQTQFSLQDELKQLESLSGQKRRVSYYAFDQKDYEGQVKVDDKVLKAYYDKHVSDYHQSQQAIVSYVKLSSKDFMPKGQVSENAIKAYFKDNQAALKTPEVRQGEIVTLHKDAKDKQAIIEALQSGKALTAAQKAQLSIKEIKPISSEDAQSHSEFTLFNLTMKSPAKELTNDEFVVLTKIQAPRAMDLKEATPVIKRILNNRYAVEKLNTVLTSLNSSTFEQVVKESNLTVKTTKAFDANTVSNDVEGNAKLQEAIFKYNKTQGFITQGHTDGIIYKLDKSIPAHTIAFDQVKNKVKKSYIDNEALALAKAAAQKQLTMLSDGKEQQNKAKTVEFSRIDFTVNQDLLTAIFSDGLNQYKVIKNNSAYWVYAVTKVTPDSEAIPQQSVENLHTSSEVSSYVDALKKHYKVEINHHLING